MPGKSAAWRMSEVAAYDVAVELANTLIAELMWRADGAAGVSSDIISLRTELELVDPRDRKSVELFTQDVERRIEDARE